jgi:hypothetical protein
MRTFEFERTEAILPIQRSVISGEPVNEPTKSAVIFVSAEIRMAGPVSSKTCKPEYI